MFNETHRIMHNLTRHTLNSTRRFYEIISKRGNKCETVASWRVPDVGNCDRMAFTLIPSTGNAWWSRNVPGYLDLKISRFVLCFFTVAMHKGRLIYAINDQRGRQWRTVQISVRYSMDVVECVQIWKTWRTRKAENFLQLGEVRA